MGFPTFSNQPPGPPGSAQNQGAMSAASCWTTLALSLAPSFSNRSTSEPQARQARCNGWQPISAWKLRHSCTTLREMMEDRGWEGTCWRYLLLLHSTPLSWFFLMPALDGMKQPVILRWTPRWGSYTKQVTARRSKCQSSYYSIFQHHKPGTLVFA